ncbi:hypothetical protein FRC18_005240 [Serendipita sp. 400]|nr:hypothetical protein FRC18_005240 [Serendipita sp. 400]
MAYAQPPQYAAHPMTVGSMPPMASMGAATGTMPQPGTQTMYGYPAPVAGRPGPPQGMPGGGMQMMVAPVGAGRGMTTTTSMQLTAQGQPIVRYGPGPGPPQPMPRGMTMPANMTMSGPGRGAPQPPPGMVMGPGMRMQSGIPGMVQRVGPPGMHPPPGQPGVGPGGHPLTAQQGHTVMSYPASGSMPPQGVMMVPPQHSPIKQSVPLYHQTTGPNPTMVMQNGPSMVNPQRRTSASPVPVHHQNSPQASASAAQTPANAPTPGQRGSFSACVGLSAKKRRATDPLRFGIL